MQVKIGIGMMDNILRKLSIYIELTRLNKPIGIFLLLWPTLTSLWLAAEGAPSPLLIFVFTFGVILMRSAGCVINDVADRGLDRHVRRTRRRPLTTGRMTVKEALLLFLVLVLLAFGLVLMTNTQTILLSVFALFLAATYPFMKRITHFPQVVLGAAFAFSIPMAFSAQRGEVPVVAWLLFTSTVVWTVAYDTLYAMVDREDDLKVGIKSSAVFFGEYDRSMVGLLQVLTLLPLLLLARQLHLSLWFDLGLVGMAALFVYQQRLIIKREPEKCFRAFLNNAWVGAFLYGGTVLHYMVGVK